MAGVAGRQVVGHGVAPLVLPAQGGDILVVNVHHHAHVVPGLDVLVDIPGDKLRGKVPRAPAHAVDRGVQNQLPLGLDAQQHLGVGKGQLQVIVAVKAQADGGVHVLVNQVELPGDLAGVHAAQGVHHVKGEGPQAVDPLHQAQQLHVRIEGGAHRLEKHLVALVQNGGGPAEGPLRVLPAEGQPRGSRWGSRGKMASGPP